MYSVHSLGHTYLHLHCLTILLFFQGISNVARSAPHESGVSLGLDSPTGRYMSLGLGLSNQVSEAFIEAKVTRIIVKL